MLAGMCAAVLRHQVARSGFMVSIAHAASIGVYYALHNTYSKLICWLMGDFPACGDGTGFEVKPVAVA